jgi:lysophospholipid acyltransferase (LPLAT)-like uncharacterized protein
MFKKWLQSAPAQAGISRAGAWYFRFVARTTSWQIEGADQLSLFGQGDKPCIVVFWHETLPSMPVFWLRAGSRRPATVLASRHRDGRLIAMAVENFGISVVAGSSSRGGAAGLRALVNALRAGQHVGLTPDGPRGPRRVAAPGVAQLAALSGASVLPCAASTKFALRTRSWDRMRLPLPFGRGRLVCGPLIHVPRTGWQGHLPEIEAGLNAAIDRAELSYS